MAKKKEEKIVEKAHELIVENNTQETNKVERYKLKIEIAFTDKYTNEDYKVGDVITIDENRYNELMNDSRKLVSEIK